MMKETNIIYSLIGYNGLVTILLQYLIWIFKTRRHSFVCLNLNRWTELWLNEGFATYAAYLASEVNYYILIKFNLF